MTLRRRVSSLGPSSDTSVFRPGNTVKITARALKTDQSVQHRQDFIRGKWDGRSHVSARMTSTLKPTLSPLSLVGAFVLLSCSSAPAAKPEPRQAADELIGLWGSEKTFGPWTRG